MVTTERIMIDEAFENQTYRVLITPLKDDAPLKIWSKVKRDDFSWWDAKKETPQIWTERKLKRELRLKKDAPLLEGMVFIKINENGRVKDVIPYTPQARAASKVVYEKASKT